MIRPLPTRAAFAAALALAIATLAGCGVADEARKKADEMMLSEGASFEKATRSQVRDAADGRTYLLRVEARRKAHWYEAMSAMSGDLGSYCPDGVPFSVRRMTPAHDPGATPPGEYTWYPAGTVFEQEVSCTDPFAGERRLAADADYPLSSAALKAELVGDSAYDRDRHLSTVVSFGGRRHKYPAVAEIIGGMVMGVNNRCRQAGVNVLRVLVHSEPSPAPGSMGPAMHANAFVGVDAVCADGLPADPRL